MIALGWILSHSIHTWVSTFFRMDSINECHGYFHGEHRHCTSKNTKHQSDHHREADIGCTSNNGSLRSHSKHGLDVVAVHRTDSFRSPTYQSRRSRLDEITKKRRRMIIFNYLLNPLAGRWLLRMSSFILCLALVYHKLLQTSNYRSSFSS